PPDPRHLTGYRGSGEPGAAGRPPSRAPPVGVPAVPAGCIQDQRARRCRPSPVRPLTAYALSRRPTSCWWTTPRANLVVLEAVLDGPGHNLVKAASGEEALRLLEGHDFAGVLLDVRMQGLDGFETARLIRGQERSRHTPIIFLTAFDDNSLSAERAYELGAVDYLVKPLVPIVLRAKVAEFVELFEPQEKARRQAEQFRRLVQGRVDYAIFLLDHEGRVVSWNPGAARIKGYKAEEIVGRHFSTFYPQDAVDRGWPAEELRRAAAEGRFEDEGWRIRKDGSRFW